MAVVSTNDLKRGMSLDLPDGLFQVVDFQHVKPGKGGAFVRTTLKNLRNGGTIDKTFRGDEKVQQAVIDKRDMQFLYKDGTDFVFMDNESYDQLNVPPVSLADAANYIVDGSTVTLQMYGTEIVGSDLPDGLFQVVDFQHVKPGKGGAFVRTTLKNLRNGATIDKTFRGDEKVEQAVIDKRDMQFLYKDGSDFVFMDNESYDQLHVQPASLASAANYIVDGSTVTLQMYGAEIVGSDLPAAVELNVTDTEPGVQGDRVSGARKPATLETGLVVQVPLFVNPGDRIKVDTRSGEYITRA